MMFKLTVLVKVRDEVGLRLELESKLQRIEMLEVTLLGAVLLFVDHKILT